MPQVSFKRELHAVQDIEDGDVICSIPLDLILAHKSDDEEFATQLGENLDEFTALAVKLLRERAQQQRSRYHPHIQVCGSRQVTEAVVRMSEISRQPHYTTYMAVLWQNVIDREKITALVRPAESC